MTKPSFEGKKFGKDSPKKVAAGWKAKKQLQLTTPSKGPNKKSKGFSSSKKGKTTEVDGSARSPKKPQGEQKKEYKKKEYKPKPKPGGRSSDAAKNGDANSAGEKTGKEKREYKPKPKGKRPLEGSGDASTNVKKQRQSVKPNFGLVLKLCFIR